MRVLLLCRYHRDGSSSRLRFLQYVPLLEDMGIDITVSPLFYKQYIKTIYAGKKASLIRIFFCYVLRLFQLTKINKYDLLWIEKELFPGVPSWFESFLTYIGKEYVVDYDDATFINYEGTVIHNKIKKIISMSKETICGNNFLSDYAYKSGARNIKILPTVVNLDLYSVAEKSLNQKPFVIGWIGSPYTAQYLSIILDVLKKLSKSYDIELHVVGAIIEHNGVKIKCFEWSESDESSLIQNFDVGIMPLKNSPWEEGKCAYKLIQYMACGIPVIGSNVGANKVVIRDGENGFLVSTEDEWLDSFKVLISEFEMRILMGSKGRKIVEENYCTNATISSLKKILS
jgi:glycosyltransferase involved in cell wall biosynthesis